MCLSHRNSFHVQWHFSKIFKWDGIVRRAYVHNNGLGNSHLLQIHVSDHTGMSQKNVSCAWNFEGRFLFYAEWSRRYSDNNKTLYSISTFLDWCSLDPNTICIISSTCYSRLFTIQVLHTLHAPRDLELSFSIERFKRANVLKMLVCSVHSRFSSLCSISKHIFFFCLTPKYITL